MSGNCASVVGGPRKRQSTEMMCRSEILSQGQRPADFCEMVAMPLQNNQA